MSTVSLTKSETASTGPICLNKQNVKLIVKEEPVFKLSSKNNPMLVFKTEITDPAVQFRKGEEQKIAGIELTIWATFFVNQDTGREENPQLAKIHDQAGLPMEFSRDENTGLPVDESGTPFRYTGIVLDAMVVSEEYTIVDDDKKPILNPRTNQEQKGYNHRVIKLY